MPYAYVILVHWPYVGYQPERLWTPRHPGRQTVRRSGAATTHSSGDPGGSDNSHRQSWPDPAIPVPAGLAPLTAHSLSPGASCPLRDFVLHPGQKTARNHQNRNRTHDKSIDNRTDSCHSCPEPMDSSRIWHEKLHPLWQSNLRNTPLESTPYWWHQFPPKSKG
jgi:hypothetical protein